jgi:hypothetical protein
VAVRVGEADLIGDNISASATLKAIALDVKGRIRDKKNRSFVAMMKKIWSPMNSG